MYIHKYTIKKGVRNYQSNSYSKEDVFVRKELLKLTPKRYLCPFCGVWHEWRVGESLVDLEFYDSDFTANYTCPHYSDYYLDHLKESMCSNDHNSYEFFFEDGYCYYAIELHCRATKIKIEGEIKVEDITEDANEPIVTFEVPFETYFGMGRKECEICGIRYLCNIANLVDQSNSRDTEITLGFGFEKSDYDKLVR